MERTICRCSIHEDPSSKYDRLLSVLARTLNNGKKNNSGWGKRDREGAPDHVTPIAWHMLLCLPLGFEEYDIDDS